MRTVTFFLLFVMVCFQKYWKVVFLCLAFPVLEVSKTWGDRLESFPNVDNRLAANSC